MQNLGWATLIQKIDQDRSDRRQRVKEAIFEDLQRYKQADGIHFDKVVLFACGLK
jgi:hypothetical protein